MDLQRLPGIDRLKLLASRLGFSLIVLVLVASFGSFARAQHCGSYVSRAGDDALIAVLGLTLEAERGPSSDGPSPAPAPALPCNGPGCSKAPAAPGTAPAPLEPPSLEHWAINGPWCRNRLTDPHVLPHSEALRYLSLLSTGVFHPPRRFD